MAFLSRRLPHTASVREDYAEPHDLRVRPRHDRRLGGVGEAGTDVHGDGCRLVFKPGYAGRWGLVGSGREAALGVLMTDRIKSIFGGCAEILFLQGSLYGAILVAITCLHPRLALAGLLAVLAAYGCAWLIGMEKGFLRAGTTSTIHCSWESPSASAWN